MVHSARSSPLPWWSVMLRLAMAGWAVGLATFSNSQTSEVAIVSFVLPLIAVTSLEDFG